MTMQGAKKMSFLGHFFALCMVIDSCQKRFVMNMQLRRCFAKDNPFRLKKARFCLAFVFSKKANCVEKEPEFQNLASKKPNRQHLTERCSASS